MSSHKNIHMLQVFYLNFSWLKPLAIFYGNEYKWEFVKRDRLFNSKMTPNFQKDASNKISPLKFISLIFLTNKLKAINYQIFILDK